MGGNLTSSSPKLLKSVKSDVINDLISKNCVVMFSKTQCTHCKKMKKMFTDLNINFQCVELDKRDDGPDLQNALQEMTGAKTVPRIFINAECIGGASDTEKLQRKNKLLDKVRMCDKTI